MLTNPANSVAGLRTEREAAYRQVTLGNEQYVPGYHVIDGTKSRDTGASPVTELRAGLLLGIITATKKLAPSVLGLTGVLHDTSVVTTTMTLPAAVVTEISRRIGASGTFKIVGPPTAAGTVATETVTYSGIASATTITITATSADFAAGSLICPTDGSETPVTILPNGFPIRVTDADGTAIDQELGQRLCGGLVDSSQIINWSSDTSVRAYLVSALKDAGNFVFDHKHGQ
jgi:hypothetical protein